MSRLSKPGKRLVKLLFFALIVHVFVLPQLGGARKAISVLSSVNPWLLTAALALAVLAFVAYARLTQLLIPEEHRPSLPVTFGAVMASTGVNHVVPGGAATTAAVNYRLLGRAGVPRNELGFALGTQAIGSAVVLNFILWIALVVSIPATGFHPVYASAAAVGAILIGVCAVAVVLLLRGSAALADRVGAVLGRLPRLEPESIRNTMLQLADQLEALASDRHRLVLVLVFAAANWLLDAAALWVALTAFGPPPSIIGVLVAYGLANVMAAIPISPGGLGVIEAILIPTIIGFGSPRSQVSIGVVVYRLVNFWMPIPVGAVAYVAVDRYVDARSDDDVPIDGLDEDDPTDFTGEINRQAAESTKFH